MMLSNKVCKRQRIRIVNDMIKNQIAIINDYNVTSGIAANTTPNPNLPNTANLQLLNKENSIPNIDEENLIFDNIPHVFEIDSNDSSYDFCNDDYDYKYDCNSSDDENDEDENGEDFLCRAIRNQVLHKKLLAGQFSVISQNHT